MNTAALLVAIVVLLVCIFGQFQPPPMNTPPEGVTVIDYTTFVKQVKAGNVLAVMIQGNAVHGLLALPFSRNATSVTRPSRNYAADIAEWSRYVSEGYLSQRYAPAHVSQQSKALSLPMIDSRRAIYTCIPGSGDASLMPLLLNNYVMVNIRPIVQPAGWLWSLLDFLLFLFLAPLLLSVLSPHATMRSPDFSDGHILDQALLRPGRFDRHISISLPDRLGREAILKVHTRHTPLHKDVSLERFSRLTTGMSGADLANLANEAALLAARHDLEHIPQACFEEALARVQLGALRPVIMSEADRNIIAYHEAGHALVAYHLPQADTVNHVTILPRGQSLGVTQFTAEEDRYNYSRETLLAHIAVGLGGRAAETLAFGPEHITTGAENDLQVVTDLARRMVTRWGMSEQIGVVFADYEPDRMSLNMRHIDIKALQIRTHALVVDTDGRVLLNGSDVPARPSTSTVSMPALCNRSTTMATLIDHEVQLILNEGYSRACALLREHYDQLTTLADALLEHEQLDRTV